MKSKRVGKPVFFVIAILIIALSCLAFFGISDYYGDMKKVYVKGAGDIRWGIDISGGVEAVFKPDMKESNISKADMAAAKEIIQTRLNDQKVTDYEVYTDDTQHQIIVRFPWAAGESDFDAQAMVEKIGASAIIYFCEGTDGPVAKPDSIILQGAKDVASASPGVDDDGKYIVQLKLTDAGKQKFADATARLLNQTISIWLDNDMKSAPTVQSAITDGVASITGMEDADAANDLANTINAGSLPFAIKADDGKLQVISPTLGSNALNVMVIAGSIAFALVCILMIVRYRLHGVIASLALLGQLAGSIACISGFFKGADSFTLTVPGIAGIILSIGVGVDCNVIAAERIRDEFHKGKTIDGAIDSGFKNSLSAVIDGNVTIVIVSLVLMGAFGSSNNLMAKILSPLMSIFGSSITGSIYAFGYTLLIGVIFNLIMGVLASKYMLKSVSQLKFLRKPALYGGKNNE